MAPSSEQSRAIQWRYLNDAEFHMRVDLAVQAIERDEGVTFDAHDRSLATLAAAYAIDLQENPALQPMGAADAAQFLAEMSAESGRIRPR